MPPISLAEPSGRYLSFAEREEIALLKAQDQGVRDIARRLGRDASTISRELRRNAATRASQRGYRASVAQWKAEQAAKRPKSAKLATNHRLRDYVQDRLSERSGIRTGRRFLVHPWRRGKAGTNPTGLIGSGSRAWSPEQISHRLKVDFTEDESMRISHEAIYQALLRARPRRATTRADRVPADRSCPASSPCENSRAGQEVHHRGGNDQPASCGG